MQFNKVRDFLLQTRLSTNIIEECFQDFIINHRKFALVLFLYQFMVKVFEMPSSEKPEKKKNSFYEDMCTVKRHVLFVINH